MTTLIEEADNLLLHQFTNANNLKGLIRALVTPFQQASNELEKLHHGRYIDNAADKTLDVIGAIVGQPRNGMSDDDYRPWLKVAIYLNNSAGTAEDLYDILGILYNKKNVVILQEYPPNDVQFILDHPPFPKATIVAIIRRAVPVTTRCYFAFTRPTSVNTNELVNLAINRKDRDELGVPFKLDHTPFDQSYFVDFRHGEMTHE